MSADNGIYILKTTDGQHRVIHTQAIDNIFYNTNENGESINCLYAYQYFCNSKITRECNKALSIANKMYNDIIKHSIIEYGIRPIEVDYTWKDICKKAKEIATKKLKQIDEKLSIVVDNNSKRNLMYDKDELTNILASLNNKSYINIQQLFKQWKNEAFSHSSEHVKKSCISYYEDNDNEIILHTTQPGYFIGKGGILFDKYGEKIYESFGKSILIKEIKTWNII